MKNAFTDNRGFDLQSGLLKSFDEWFMPITSRMRTTEGSSNIVTRMDGSITLFGTNASAEICSIHQALNSLPRNYYHERYSTSTPMQRKTLS